MLFTIIGILIGASVGYAIGNITYMEEYDEWVNCPISIDPYDGTLYRRSEPIRDLYVIGWTIVGAIIGFFNIDNNT